VGKLSKEVKPITRNSSPSPESKMRLRGDEFLRKIERLQADLKVEGDALELIENDIKQE